MATQKEQIISDVTDTIQGTNNTIWSQRKRVTDTFNTEKNVNINIDITYDHGKGVYGILVNGYLLDPEYAPADLATMADKTATVYGITTQAGVTNLLETESADYVAKTADDPTP